MNMKRNSISLSEASSPKVTKKTQTPSELDQNEKLEMNLEAAQTCVMDLTKEKRRLELKSVEDDEKIKYLQDINVSMKREAEKSKKVHEDEKGQLHSKIEGIGKECDEYKKWKDDMEIWKENTQKSYDDKVYQLDMCSIDNAELSWKNQYFTQEISQLKEMNSELQEKFDTSLKGIQQTLDDVNAKLAKTENENGKLTEENRNLKSELSNKTLAADSNHIRAIKAEKENGELKEKLQNKESAEKARLKKVNDQLATTFKNISLMAEVLNPTENIDENVNPNNITVSSSVAKMESSNNWLKNKKSPITTEACDLLFKESKKNIDEFTNLYINKFITYVEGISSQKEMDGKIEKANSILKHYFKTVPVHHFKMMLQIKRNTERQKLYEKCDNRKLVVVTSEGEIFFLHQENSGRFIPYSDVELQKRLKITTAIRFDNYEIPEIYEKREFFYIFEKNPDAMVRKFYLKSKSLMKI